MTLRGLERDGLVKRTSFPTIPPRVDYELTARGQSLQEPLRTLAAWGRAQQAGIEASQRRYDERVEAVD
jgi:DNA-binding HxlR family transcriptional regulator